MACHRIEELYHETKGKCYISFSGGKDSTVLLALTKLCIDAYTLPAEGIPAVFSNTGIELGVTVDFVNWCKDSGWYPNIIIIRPKKPFAWVLKNSGKPIRSKQRSQILRQWHLYNRSEALYSLLIKGKTLSGGSAVRDKLADRDMHMIHDDFNIVPSKACCDWMKKKPFEAFAKENGYEGTLQGVRIQEGGARSTAAMKRIKAGSKLCTWIKHGVIQKAPIIDWSEDDVNAFIEKYNVPLSRAYTEFGFERTGCMACPYSRNLTHDLAYLFDYEPNRYKAAMFWLKDVYIAQNVVLPFDPEYERERERGHGKISTNL